MRWRGVRDGITPPSILNAREEQPARRYVKPGNNATEPKFYTRGKYVLRTHWEGGAFVYDILRSGMLVSSGFDLLSRSEEKALQKIMERFYS